MTMPTDDDGRLHRRVDEVSVITTGPDDETPRYVGGRRDWCAACLHAWEHSQAFHQNEGEKDGQ